MARERQGRQLELAGNFCPATLGWRRTTVNRRQRSPNDTGLPHIEAGTLWRTLLLPFAFDNRHTRRFDSELISSPNPTAVSDLSFAPAPSAPPPKRLCSSIGTMVSQLAAFERRLATRRGLASHVLSGAEDPNVCPIARAIAALTLTIGAVRTRQSLNGTL